MNKKLLHTAISVALASSTLYGCTHMPAPADEDLDDVIISEEKATTKPAPAAIMTANNVTEAPAPSMPTIPSQSSNNTSHLECGTERQALEDQHFINNKGTKAESVKIRVTGYGAPPKAFYPDPQRRLMAMRAAKIDAYRSMAERVAGLQIWGGTTIGAMVVEKDRFRVYLDTHLTGAKVITESQQEDGTFETVVELKVGQPFLKTTLPKKVKLECKERMHQPKPFDLGNAKQASVNPPGHLINSNFYYQDE